MAGAPSVQDSGGQEDGGVSYHRRDIRRDLRVYHCLGHDVGWIQLEVEFSMVNITIAVISFLLPSVAVNLVEYPHEKRPN